MKKTILLLCALLAALFSLSMTAGAQTPQDRPGVSPTLVCQSQAALLDAQTGEEALPPDYAGAQQALIQGILACEERIDLSAYNIPAGAGGMHFIDHVFSPVLYRRGELFNLSGGITIYSLGGEDDPVTEVLPEYLMTPAEFAQAQPVLEAKVQAILDQIPAGLTDAEKVLFVHDYVVAHQSYFSPPEDSGIAPIKDVYQFLTLGMGDCQAYTLTFEVLMDALGIPVSFVESSNLFHVWNMVQLDGKWYEIDLTHDDPTVTFTSPLGDDYPPLSTEILGGVQHAYCLITSATCEALRRGIWESGTDYPWEKDWVYGEDVVCGDDTYEKMGLPSIISPCTYLPETDTWYCLRTFGLRGAQLIAWSRGQKTVDALGTYAQAYMANPLVLCNGSLYFSMPSQIYRYDLEAQKQTLIHQSAMLLYGMEMQEEQLLYRQFDMDREDIVLISDPSFSAYPEGNDFFRYYFAFDTMGVYLPQGKDYQVVIAWYEQRSNRLADLQLLSKTQSFDARPGLRCAAFVLSADGDLIPLAPSKFWLRDGLPFS